MTTKTCDKLFITSCKVFINIHDLTKPTETHAGSVSTTRVDLQDRIYNALSISHCSFLQLQSLHKQS